MSHPFVGDYVKLRENSKWKKMSADTDDQHLVFADIVMKVNRRDGKVRSRSHDTGILLISLAASRSDGVTVRGEFLVSAH